jgi:DNA polymerase
VTAEARRRAYLKALEIDVYTLRGQDDAEEAEPERPQVEVPLPDWAALRDSVAACTRCALHQSRTQTVFGVGSQSADWMIIGEAPGQEEDRRGEPFVGRAGKLLDEMLRAVGLDRGSVFIANILKCRPPSNRDPAADEAASCRQYLERQIELVAPKIILAVGRIAAQHLLNTDAPVGRMRGRKHYLGDGQLPVVVTYHPAYLLRSPTQKSKVWQDLLLARQLMEGTDP